MTSRPTHLPPQLDAPITRNPAGQARLSQDAWRSMLAEIGDEARSDPKWLYEPKLDGYRVIAFVERQQARACNRAMASTAPQASRKSLSELATPGDRQDGAGWRGRRLR